MLSKDEFNSFEVGKYCMGYCQGNMKKCWARGLDNDNNNNDNIYLNQREKEKRKNNQYFWACSRVKSFSQGVTMVQFASVKKPGNELIICAV